MNEKNTRITLAQARKLRGLSDSRRVKEMTDEEIDRIIASDPDLYELTDQELAQFSLARNPKDGK